MEWSEVKRGSYAVAKRLHNGDHKARSFVFGTEALNIVVSTAGSSSHLSLCQTSRCVIPTLKPRRRCQVIYETAIGQTDGSRNTAEVLPAELFE